ncbi:MAG: glycosyltransferase family 39 protein [Candidatus Contendobacter sp.]|nr:glycosyltransferase family 39 protein [Candidatus Contendobacter sp.]
MLKRAAELVRVGIPSSNKLRYLVINLLKLAIDLGVLSLLHSQGFSLSFSHITSFLVASGTSYFLHTIWYHNEVKYPPIKQLIVIVLLIIFLRGGILASLAQSNLISPGATIILCVFISSICSHLVRAYFTPSLEFNFPEFGSNPGHLTIILMIYSVFLRLSYLGSPELFYEEAYYWNYAQHLDIGYLDHPPMVAWIIEVFTKMMGDNEFAVRFGAFACWLIAAFFSYKLACKVHDRSSAVQTLLLMATWPVYFAAGWVMTPDAPLIACWAAALYYFYQALINEQRLAWIGIGISIGLGMLSKYTMVLLGPAAVLFILVDRHSRKWIFKPEPYLAIITAIIIFLPVIAWNAEHEWASFFYQSHDRVAERFEFSLPYFISSIILIITPTGFVSLIVILLYKNAVFSSEHNKSSSAIHNIMDRSYLLLMVLTFSPVAVFLALSLFRETKFHWTAPCWLGIVSYIALIANRGFLGSQSGGGKLLTWSQRAWPTTIVTCLVCYGAALHYLSLGFPGIPYPQNLYLLGWRSFGDEVEKLVEQIERETNEKILVVGMDRNRIASGLAFYRTEAITISNERVSPKPAFQTSSWHLFGGKGLMYEYWFPSERQNKKTMLLISKSITNLTSDEVYSRVRQEDGIKEITFSKNGKWIGRYYCLLVREYQNHPSKNMPPMILGD